MDIIVYRELSSLSRDLGISARTLYTVSNHVQKHYHAVQVQKNDGSMRRLLVPDRLLKTIQRRIYNTLLCRVPISPYATAYRPAGSPLRNAQPHIGKPVLLKLDIRHFFDHILYADVKDLCFPAERYSSANRILLALLCVYQDILPQGAPTSPAISNIIMKSFDDTVGTWCASKGITYTRYCDDMTFSGAFDPVPVITFVSRALRKRGFFLNQKKTVIVHRGQRQTVTGIVVNQKASVPAEYRRALRQELYYCRAYSVASHMAHRGIKATPAEYLAQLYGKVCYVLSIDPDNAEMLTYRMWLEKQRALYKTNPTSK